jgi:hypothetical protein
MAAGSTGWSLQKKNSSPLFEKKTAYSLNSILTP